MTLCPHLTTTPVSLRHRHPRHSVRVIIKQYPPSSVGHVKQPQSSMIFYILDMGGGNIRSDIARILGSGHTSAEHNLHISRGRTSPRPRHRRHVVRIRAPAHIRETTSQHSAEGKQKYSVENIVPFIKTCLILNLVPMF